MPLVAAGMAARDGRIEATALARDATSLAERLSLNREYLLCGRQLFRIELSLIDWVATRRPCSALSHGLVPGRVSRHQSVRDCAVKRELDARSTARTTREGPGTNLDRA